MKEHANQATSAVIGIKETKARSVSFWGRTRPALVYNADLSERVLWCLGVDWHRALGRFAWQRSGIDRLFLMAFCWEWWAVAQYRFAYWVHRRRPPDFTPNPILQWLFVLQQATLLRFCYLTARMVEALSGARLNGQAEVGPGLLLMHTGSCGIAYGAKIGCNFSMYQDANVAARRDEGFPTIGDNVTLHSGARVLGPVHVGDNVRVGANAVVLHDIPPGCVALGVPAQPLVPGERPGPYPALVQLQDLLATLVEQNSLEEIAPGRYRDRLSGTELELTCTEPACLSADGLPATPD